MNNPDFSEGDTRYYNVYGGGEAIIVAPFSATSEINKAMAVRKRTSEQYGVAQAIDNRFLSANDAYRVSCEIKLLADHNMTIPFYCDPTAISGDTRCPTLSLRSQNIGTGFLVRVIASSPTIFRSDGFNIFSGVFQFMQHEIKAESLYLIINNAPKDIVMVIDNVQMNKHNLLSLAPSFQPSLSAEPSLSPNSQPRAIPTDQKSLYPTLYPTPPTELL